MIKDVIFNKLFQFLFISIAFSGIAGCKLADKLTQFDMEYETRVTVPASSGINLPFNLLTPSVPTNSTSQFESNNTRKDLVEEIRLTSLILLVESPAGEDFSFLENIAIFIKADGLPERKIAWKEPVPEPVGNKISLDVSGEDLKEYVKKDQFSLRVYTDTDEALAEDHTIKVSSVFFVNAKLANRD